MAIETARPTKRRVAPRTEVYLKTNWTDDWLPYDQLFCNRRRFGVSPAGSDAELEHRFGFGKEFNRQQFEEVQPYLVNGSFVRIVQTGGDEAEAGDGPFVGVLQVESQNVFGTVPDENGADTANGVEVYVAVGLEELLRRKKLTESIVADGSGGEKRIGRGLAFNKFADDSSLIAGGNASATFGAENTLIFADTLANSSDRRYWTSLDIVKYLLAYHAPGAGLNEANIDWQITGDIDWLASHTPAMDVHGRAISEILDQLINPQRGAVWWLAVDGTTVEVRVATFTDVALQFSSSQPVLSANNNIVDVIADDDPAVTVHNETRTTASHYDRVIVRGARIGCCFSISIADGTAEEDWTSSDESAYKDAASGAGDYPSNDADKQERNDNYRQADSLAHVYTRFRLPADWDGLAGDGLGGDQSPAVPILEELSNNEILEADEADTFWVPGLRFERQLPLLAAADYADDAITAAIADGYTSIPLPDDTLPEGSIPDMLPPFAVIQIEDGSPDRYQYVEKLAGARDDLNFSCTLRMLDNQPGFVIDPEGPAHLIASDDFDPDSEEPTAHRPVLDFKSLIATVYMQADRQVEARFPSDDDFDNGSYVYGGSDIAVLSELVIEAGEQYRAEYVAPGTVVGLADGELVASDGGLVRDDRGILRTIAQMAYQWYDIDRAAVSLTWRSISGFPQMGSYIRTIDGGSVNAVVTSLEHDFLRSTTTMQTSLAELDFVALVGSNA